MLSPAHNPLLIPELFQCILDCFLLELHSPEIRAERRALVALARTCRALSEPSLDRLWHKLHSLLPLFRCFSSKRAAPDPEVMTPPTSAEWAVIRRYSHRVLELILVSIPTIDITTFHFNLKFLDSICSQPSPLFPNLKILEWWPRETRSIHLSRPIRFIWPLLSPTLLILRVSFTDKDGLDLHWFLKHHPFQCRNLETVQFYFLQEDETKLSQTTHELSRALCTGSYERLKRLEIHGLAIDADAFKWLSMSPTIRFISVHHFPQASFPQPYFHLEDTPFQHAMELELTTSKFDFVISLLRPRDQRLRSFRLHVLDRPTTKAASKFFSLLASRPDVGSLETLNLRFTLPHATPEGLALRSLSYQELHELTPFRCLRELVVDWSHDIFLNDDELADLTSAWPSLQVFALNCYRAADPPANEHLTLQGLLNLVSACPDLEEVSLSLDARDIPTGLDPNFRNTSLKYLDFPESPILESNAPLVAEFLHKRFPCLRSVHGPHGRRPDRPVLPTGLSREIGWNRVENFISHPDELDTWFRYMGVSKPR